MEPSSPYPTKPGIKKSTGSLITRMSYEGGRLRTKVKRDSMCTHKYISGKAEGGTDAK